jgi:hypothetical protein
MRKPIVSGLVAALLLSACGGSGGSSANSSLGGWFGRSRSAPVAEGEVNPLIPETRGVFRRREAAAYGGVPVETIAEMHVERTAGGALLQVKGIAQTQGYHDARLVEDEDDGSDTTLTFTLRAVPSGLRELIGPPQSRQIVAAKALTENDLLGIRTIRVRGVQNARTTSRRF